MAWIFSKGKPINQQIADKITIDVLTGKILPQQRLPAPEEMHNIVGASTQVIISAYEELIADGTVSMHGKLYIINTDLTAAKARRERILRDIVKAFLTDATQIGVNSEEILMALRDEMANFMD